MASPCTVIAGSICAATFASSAVGNLFQGNVNEVPFLCNVVGGFQDIFNTANQQISEGNTDAAGDAACVGSGNLSEIADCTNRYTIIFWVVLGVVVALGIIILVAYLYRTFHNPVLKIAGDSLMGVYNARSGHGSRNDDDSDSDYDYDSGSDSGDEGRGNDRYGPRRRNYDDKPGMVSTCAMPMPIWNPYGGGYPPQMAPIPPQQSWTMRVEYGNPPPSATPSQPPPQPQPQPPAQPQPPPPSQSQPLSQPSSEEPPAYSGASAVPTTSTPSSDEKNAPSSQFLQRLRRL